MYIYYYELYLRTIAKVFFSKTFSQNVSPLQLQHQKLICDLFKKKSLEAYEVHMMSNSTVRSTL